MQKKSNHHSKFLVFVFVSAILTVMVAQVSADQNEENGSPTILVSENFILRATSNGSVFMPHTILMVSHFCGQGPAVAIIGDVVKTNGGTITSFPGAVIYASTINSLKMLEVGPGTKAQAIKIGYWIPAIPVSPR
ncbi:MAG TPA: hypothetical protein VK255_01680 [Patescibacteria group bacterium]|nr:hypothetical protein [Patescibacteria group bacterium]